MGESRSAEQAQSTSSWRIHDDWGYLFHDVFRFGNPDWRIAGAKAAIASISGGDDTLKWIVESDLVYLLVLAVLLYSKQLQIAFSGTSFYKEQTKWNREQLNGSTTLRVSAF